MVRALLELIPSSAKSGPFTAYYFHTECSSHVATYFRPITFSNFSGDTLGPFLSMSWNVLYLKYFLPTFDKRIPANVDDIYSRQRIFSGKKFADNKLLAFTDTIF